MKEYLILILLIVILLSIPLGVQNSETDMMTYADFNHIRHIASSMSHVYFATSNGIIRYNKMEMVWENPLTGSLGIDHRDIQRVWVDQFDEKLVAQTSDSYYEYELVFEDWYPINDLPPIEKSYVHVKLQTVMYPPDGFNFSQEGYLIDPLGRDFFFTDIIDDRSGRSWMGTWGYGAAVSGGSTGLIEFIPYGLIQNHVNTIYIDKGTILIGGFDDYDLRTGISMLNPDENDFSYIESAIELDFPNCDVTCFETDSLYIYIGTDIGLFMWDRVNETIEKRIDERSGLLDDYILTLGKNGDSLLVGTVDGLSYLFAETDSIGYIRSDQFNNVEIYDFELTDSALWVATSKGAYQLLLDSNKLQKFQDPHNIVFDRAFKIERSNNILWFSSESGFVSLNLNTGNTRSYPSITRGFINRAMAVNERVLAFATELGFKLVYYTDPERIIEREFTVQDGLPSARVNALEFDGDFLWIATDLGLTEFYWNNADRID